MFHRFRIVALLYTYNIDRKILTLIINHGQIAHGYYTPLNIVIRKVRIVFIGVKHILSYDERYVIRNGAIVVINQIDKPLPIYELFSQKPKIIASKKVNGSPDYFSALAH